MARCKHLLEVGTCSLCLGQPRTRPGRDRDLLEDRAGSPSFYALARNPLLLGQFDTLPDLWEALMLPYLLRLIVTPTPTEEEEDEQ